MHCMNVFRKTYIKCIPRCIILHRHRVPHPPLSLCFLAFSIVSLPKSAACNITPLHRSIDCPGICFLLLEKFYTLEVLWMPLLRQPTGARHAAIGSSESQANGTKKIERQTARLNCVKLKLYRTSKMPRKRTSRLDRDVVNHPYSSSPLPYAVGVDSARQWFSSLA